MQESAKQIRCVNKKTNKVRFFSKHLVDNPIWRKNTGFEPQEAPHQNTNAKAVVENMKTDFPKIGKTPA